MSQSEKQWDPWSLAAAAMWAVYFFAGLSPEWLYFTLRDWGDVSILTAMVNSPHMITLAFSAFLGLFAYHRCLDVGLTGMEAKGRALQFIILGLVAFLNFPLSQVTHLSDIPVPNLRVIVIVVALAKTSAWFYLLIVVMRYSLLGHTQAFAAMASIFPSTYQETSNEDQLGETSSVQWIDSQDDSGATTKTTDPGEPSEPTLSQPAGSKDDPQ